jgi:hypothetical protein
MHCAAQCPLLRHVTILANNTNCEYGATHAQIFVAATISAINKR